MISRQDSWIGLPLPLPPVGSDKASTHFSQAVARHDQLSATRLLHEECDSIERRCTCARLASGVVAPVEEPSPLPKLLVRLWPRRLTVPAPGWLLLLLLSGLPDGAAC